MPASLGFDRTLTCAMQVKDLNQAIEWYRSVLGWELAYKLDAMGWCEFHTPIDGVTVGLSQVERPQVEGGATLTWGVEDIDATRRTLEKQDVRFDGDTITIEDMVRLATFYDRDGNKMMLSQTLKRLAPQ